VSIAVAVVTGANRGIGRAITVTLAADGFTVAASARDRASVADTVEEAREAGGTAVPLACDVRDEASVAKMAAEAEALGPVHAVIANAGVAGPTQPLHEMTLEDWRDTVATDLDGVFLTFRAFIPAMIERRGGSLIAISSMTGKRPLRGRTPYAAAKMGVIGLVRTLATEVAAACAFLASEGAAAVTGEDLNVTAGVIMY
jgi:NAD(P)-dependent dehydrogenase (short-subunit alcohol dehydrogenase family)